MIKLRADISSAETTIPVDTVDFPIGSGGTYRVERFDLYTLGDPAEVVWVDGVIDGDEPALVVHRGMYGPRIHEAWGITRNRKAGDTIQPVTGLDYLDDNVYWRYGPMEGQWTPVKMRATRVDIQEISTIIDIEDAERMGFYDRETGVASGGRYTGSAFDGGRPWDPCGAGGTSDGNPG